MSARFTPLVFAACFAIGVTAYAAPDPGNTPDPQKLQAQLKSLEAEITRFQKMLDQTKGEKADLQKELEQNEKSISDLMKKIDDIQKKIDAGNNKISGLMHRQRDLEVAKANQQQLIVRQIRAAYRIGSQEYLKVVLNQQDPNELSRMLTYYDYFNRARAAQVQTYRATIASLEQVKQQIAVQNDQLDEDKQSLATRQAALGVSQAKRQLTLAALNEQIRKTGSEIETRMRNKARLQDLLDRITASIVNLPSPTDTLPFATQRGKLLLPVAGIVTNHFGAARNSGKLHWDGIFIAAPPGTPVKAIHYGRVVFSDWLRGFGMLLIIDHGDGYMSLYGHNQVLYRDVGDWVTAGETIATVGDTGGQKRPGLYFEIRHAGKPTDPQRWCQARPRGNA